MISAHDEKAMREELAKLNARQRPAVDDDGLGCLAFLGFVLFAGIVGAVAETWGNAAAWVFGIMIIAVPSFLWFKHDQRCDKRKEFLESRLNSIDAARRQAQNQQRAQAEADKIAASALTTIEQLPVQITDADHSLDDALNHFRDQLYVPFWESIHSAAAALARVHEYSVSFAKLRDSHTRAMAALSGLKNSFPVAGDAIVAASTAAAISQSRRMDDIVRRSQRSYEFSSIYLQMRTNSLLVTGFRSLADAVDRLTTQLETSFHALARDLESLQKISASAERAVTALDSVVLEQVNTRSLLQHADQRASAREQELIRVLDRHLGKGGGP